jgi:hypothetical protein
MPFCGLHLRAPPKQSSRQLVNSFFHAFYMRFKGHYVKGSVINALSVALGPFSRSFYGYAAAQRAIVL